jgi:hypothetical protein
MEPPLLRLLIQEKLADGRLPATPLPRLWTGAGHGQTCDGCGETITTAQAATGNLDAAGGGGQFHVACYHVWDVERQASGREPGVRLPARSGFGVPGARPGRPWAPSTPPARPTRVTSP